MEWVNEMLVTHEGKGGGRAYIIDAVCDGFGKEVMVGSEDSRDLITGRTF